MTAPIEAVTALPEKLREVAALEESNWHRHREVAQRWAGEAADALEAQARELAAETERADMAVRQMIAQNARIAALEEALRLCRRTLAMMIAPDAVKQTTVINAFAAVTEAEARARTALSNGEPNDR